MNMKIFIFIVIIMIITTLSQIISLVSNEHSLYKTVQDKCTKCHGDIKVELISSARHSYLSCTYCHTKSATNHTNIKSNCKYCHQVGLNDTLEAHGEFNSLNSKGCVECHTNYNVIVNYSRPEYIEYDITNNNGNWVVSNFTTTGNLNLSYNALKIGGKHNWKGRVSCNDCHKDVFSAVYRGGHATVFGKNGTQTVTHNTSNYPDLTAWCTNCHNRTDAAFPTKQHSARKTTCDECHEVYRVGHPGNLNTNIKVIPRLYRSLACISCKSTGWNAEYIMNNNGTLHFRVHQEPYYGVQVWNATTLIAVVYG